jgi:quercetin 2,3-dioxygenase
MNREIQNVLAAHSIIDDGDMVLLRALPAAGCDAVGPFVFFDHYCHRTLRGIGDKPHPHAGIEVISYMLEGGMDHRDSLGFRDRLDPGDAQWIRAGSGILHAEQPLGGRHGLQLWASLPPGQKFAEPAYASWRLGDPASHVRGGRSRWPSQAGDRGDFRAGTT